MSSRGVIEMIELLHILTISRFDPFNTIQHDDDDGDGDDVDVDEPSPFSLSMSIMENPC